MPASVVQKALDRVEVAMGAKAFFVVGERRTSRLTPEGERFIARANALLDAWNATLST